MGQPNGGLWLHGFAHWLQAAWCLQAMSLSLPRGEGINKINSIRMTFFVTISSLVILLFIPLKDV